MAGDKQNGDAVDAASEGGYTVGPQDFTPPNVSWTTMTNLIERFAKEGGLPSQVDRSYLSNLPGSTQTAVIAALRSLKLVDDSLSPTEDLESWVSEPDDRQGLIAEILRIYYPGPLSLGPNATQQQLEDKFREFGVTGSTLRKAIAFFLSAASYAELALSPHFRVPKQPTTGPSAPRRRTGGKPESPPPPSNRPEPPPVELPPAMKHELIAGLVRELPKPGAAFPDEKQDAWFEIAKATFRLIYNKSEPDDGEVRLNLTPSGTEG